MENVEMKEFQEKLGQMALVKTDSYFKLAKILDKEAFLSIIVFVNSIECLVYASVVTSITNEVLFEESKKLIKEKMETLLVLIDSLRDTMKEKK